MTVDDARELLAAHAHARAAIIRAKQTVATLRAEIAEHEANLALCAPMLAIAETIIARLDGTNVIPLQKINHKLAVAAT